MAADDALVDEGVAAVSRVATAVNPLRTEIMLGPVNYRGLFKGFG